MKRKTKGRFNDEQDNQDNRHSNGCLDDDQIARIDRIPEVIRVRVV